MNRITHDSCRRACLTAWLTLAAGSPLLWPTFREAWAGQYTFVNIADSSGPLGNDFGRADINDDGMVAFRNIRDDGSTAIYTGNGGPITLQVTNQGPFISLWPSPVINNSGTVAFWAETNMGLRGIYTVTDTIVNTVVDTHIGSPYLDLDTYPAINDVGTVCHSGHIVHPCCGPDTGIGANGGVTYNPAGAFFALNWGTINNSGVLGFAATLDSFTSGIFTGSGGAHTTIATAGSTFVAFLTVPVINDSGAVAFLAMLPANEKGIYIGSGGPLTTITTTAGPFSSYGSNAIGFNNNGDVVFLAFLDRGEYGIFTGPDPVADKVIEVGDTLFSAPVGSLGVDRGINNHGDIAFTYTLLNEFGGTGVRGVAVARAKTAALLGDLNGDGHVNGIDLALLLGQWTGGGSYAPCPRFAPADMNHDCKVNGLDLALLLGAWG